MIGIFVISVHNKLLRLWPQKAIVLCDEEKSQIQPLNRTQPILPLRPGLPEKATHDHQRNGPATLVSEFEVTKGSKLDFAGFMKLFAAE